MTTYELFSQPDTDRTWYGIDLEKEIFDEFRRYLLKKRIEFECSENGNLIHFECFMTVDDRLRANMFINRMNDVSTRARGPLFKFLTGTICIPTIKNVIFNDPATIVFWTDGTKTVVKTQNGETYDPEKGLAMAISKKALGNKGNYFNEIKKWTDTLLLYGIKANIES